MNCPNVPGQSRHPHTRDCNRYFICDNGELLIFPFLNVNC
jgi:hypothetical protein